MITGVTLVLAIFVVGIYWGNRKILKHFWKIGGWRVGMNEVQAGFTGVPGIGFLPYFHGVSCRENIIWIREQYGNICKVRLGSYDFVWLNEYSLIKQAWTNSAFCGRPDLDGISLRTDGFKGGIIFNDGRDFKEQRQFVNHTLRVIGLRTMLSEQYISEEIEGVVQQIKEKKGVLISTRHLFNIPAFNIIWRLVTGGTRFKHDNPEMSKLVKVLNRNMELNDGACLAFFMPWLSKLFPGMIGWTIYVKDAKFIFQFWMNFAENAVREHTSNKIEDDSYQASLICLYCEKIEKCEDPTSSFYGSKGVKSLATVLQDLFIAGSETTATTLQWICLYLAAFPACQRKIFEEIKTVLDPEDDCSSALPAIRRGNGNNCLPFSAAFINECLRYSTLAPLGMVHSTTQDVLLHGYFFPKGTLLHMNVCAVHFDKQCWKNPEEFMPERFLTEEGKLRTGEIPGFLPFSLGKRMCPGAEIAKQTLLMATVDILRKFEIHGESNMAMELRPKIGVSAVPYPHKLRFLERHAYLRK